MPTICIASDTHGSHHEVKLPHADIAIHCGDFSSDGGEEGVIDFLRWYQAQSHRFKVLCAGNHDRIPYQSLALFRDLLAAEAPSIIYLEDSTVDIMGLKVHGSPYTPAFMRWHFMSDRGPDIQRHWDMIPDDVDVLVTHGPPMGVHDGMPHDFLNPEAGRQHVGCANLATTIRERLKRLKVAAHGHVHLHGGKKTMQDGVLYVNASVMDESYEVTREPAVVNL